MTKEQEEKLLEEAKQRFPPGTKFFPAHILNNSGTYYCIITEDSHFKMDGNNIYSMIGVNYWMDPSNTTYGNTSLNRTIWENGKWAEIISKPESNTETRLGSLPDKWCIKITNENLDFLKSKRDIPFNRNHGYLLSKLINTDKSWFYTEYPDKEYTEITLEEFKKWVLKEEVKEDKPSKDKPFYVVVTEENQEILSKWRFINLSLSTAKLAIGGIVGLCLWNNKNLEKGHNSTKIIQGADYTLGNEISFEQFLELYPEYKEDIKPKFEVGKWYKTRMGSYIKYLHSNDGIFISSEEIMYNNKIHSVRKGCFGEINQNTYELLTDLSEIQEYLPLGHTDKINIIPEYVECIEKWYGIGTSEINKIYETSIPNNFSKWTIKEIIEGKATTKDWKSYFKPSSKEAFDLQNKSRSLIGRYVKFIKNNEFKDWIYQITSEHQSGNSYDATRLKDNSLNCYLSRDSFELLPEDYVPLDTKKVILEKDNKIFKKDDYIVCLKLKSSFIGTTTKVNYITKQREDADHLRVIKDLHESRNGHFGLKYNKSAELEDWRYATSEEIAEYDRIGKPYDVTTLNTKKETSKSYEYEVVHCKTQEQWDFVNSKLVSLGYQLPPSDWNFYKENSCKDLKEQSYSGLTFFKHTNSLIYSFEEWCNKFNHKPNFNSSEKEKPSLVGRYLKALIKNPQGTDFEKGQYIKIIKDVHDYYEVGLEYRNFGANVSRTDLWELMPEGFDPKNTISEKINETKQEETMEYTTSFNYNDLLKSNGCKAEYQIVKHTGFGIITIENNKVYICQNDYSGLDCKDKKGFKFSYVLSSEFGHHDFYSKIIKKLYKKQLLPTFYIKYNSSITESLFAQLIKSLKEQGYIYHYHVKELTYSNFQTYGYIRSYIEGTNLDNTFSIDNNCQSLKTEKFITDFINIKEQSKEEWIPKIGEWVTVKIDSNCIGNDAYKIMGKTFKITEEITKKDTYGLYCLGYKDQFPEVFPLGEGGIYIKYLRAALPHEIPNYISSIDPVKSDNFVLPKKWFIKVTKESLDSINIVRSKYSKECGHKLTVGLWDVISSDDYGGSNLTSAKENGFIEITLEQFKKYVLKEDTFINTFNPLTDPPLKKQTTIKAELDLIPIKQLKTFNN